MYVTEFAKRGLIHAITNIEKSRFEILNTVYLENAWCLVYEILHQSIVIQGNSLGVLFDGLLAESPAILDSFFTSTTKILEVIATIITYSNSSYVIVGIDQVLYIHGIRTSHPICIMCWSSAFDVRGSYRCLLTCMCLKSHRQILFGYASAYVLKDTCVLRH